jgi:hypothetical protein
VAKDVVENLLVDNPRTLGAIMESNGYGSAAIHTPSVVLNSAGFQEALASTGLRQALEAEGINPKKIAEKINVLLNATNGENDDYTAIDKGLKHATAIYGITEEKPTSENKTTYNFIFSSETQEKVKMLDAEIKNLLTKQHVQTSETTLGTDEERPTSSS